MNWSSAILAVSAGTLALSVATAQSPGPRPGPRNLQVLPADTPGAEVMTIMKGFSAALGVKCTHCHVGTPPNMDFASDAKKEKQTARAMLRMVHRINEQDFGVKQFKDVKVTCFTCHRGATKPLTAPPATPVPAVAPVQAPAERG